MGILKKWKDWYRGSALKYFYSKELYEDTLYGYWSIILGFIFSTIMFWTPLMMIFFFIVGLNPLPYANSIPEVVGMIPVMLWFMLLPCHIGMAGIIQKQYYEATEDFPKRIHNYKDFVRLYDTKTGKRKKR
ncbi:hypothetical protein KKC87_04465 [Patescibacteria group bacterium]|nr:hypothetical protein [Patescibacteria group bacterium]